MKHIPNAAIAIGLMCLLMILTTCATTGPGGEKSIILLTTRQEVNIGQQMDQEIRKTEDILDDPEWQNYITEIGQSIVAVSDRNDLDYQFAVIASDQVNAFAAPGGFIYFYSGLIKEFESEAELAAVMAHEISHVVARHGVQRLQTAMGASLLLQLALGDSSPDIQQIAGTGIGLLMQGYSRSQEAEADEYGVIYATRAGWHPHGFVDMFQTLQELSGRGEASFFEMLAASHPQTSTRIENVRTQIDSMAPLPEDLIRDTNRFQEMKRRLP